MLCYWICNENVNDQLWLRQIFVIFLTLIVGAGEFMLFKNLSRFRCKISSDKKTWVSSDENSGICDEMNSIKCMLTNEIILDFE